MRLKRALLFVHKWLALIVGIQVGIWLLSGFVMALLPIETVRSEHNIAEQAPVPLAEILPVAVTSGQAMTLAGGHAVAVTLTSLVGEPVYEVRRDDSTVVLVDARGAFLISPIQADLARRIAGADFAGAGQPIAAELVTAEGGDYRGRLPAWRITFDDEDATRIYVAADDGKVTARRSDTWRLYDFFWMLHIMDYGARENFNTPWMIVLSLAGLLVALSGLPLLWYAVLKPLFMRRAAKSGRASEDHAMTPNASALRAPEGSDPIASAQAVAAATQTLLARARAAVRAKVSKDGKVSAALFEKEQHAAHGLSWLATYTEALGQMHRWAEHLKADGKLGEIETLILEIGVGEYALQIVGGIPMSQGEIVRPYDLGLDDDAIGAFWGAVSAAAKGAQDPARKARLAALIAEHPHAASHGVTGLDETMEMIRAQFRKFADDKVAPFANDWHLKDEFIPMPVVEEMGELGVFGLTLPEEFGGAGLGKTAMCVVSEELCRGYIGVGSLATRSEIAGELILANGTAEQKARWLPGVAAGTILPTAVFTEPNTGSDLASLRTRAVKEGDVWKVTGNKTWITHAARADIMTLLVRTDPNAPGYKGLSMLIAPKPRGDDETHFPVAGMSGSEIEVLGYRGMKEYEIGFDGFEVPAANLLGGEEGQGFKQLMQTFESARIQTAARAVGVAQAALELGLRYALDRIQFGKPLFSFPRVSNKLVMMAVEIMIARQMTYFAAREKDEGRRCDLEAGMAKLLGARVAWAAADNALQIHGGNGFALEYPISRVLCDARILNIFEGAAEVQAMVIARRLLEEGAN